ncbi:isoleucine--tRNA ligase [Roseospirillum parvum]|uniref:Isoleucine--tRNA ligase n=1 Tax=Roseospirillum parvum TaxID=83401 RepID=A0A1G8EL25_9PROT|nr:isoleucine--tRNA ligase [Roseospirillum parvum]SDH70399.1 isoleucyl-tRNA synthetase [Roseospirillum parvum]
MSETPDYKSTVFLPRTDFPMRAGLPKKEPGILERWAGIDLYRRQREAGQGREKFILHDGPPYANGHLHIGHALNKILKDVISRSQQMLGKDSNYVPGWDCHGLPIEWKIEEQYRAKGHNKDDIPINDFRRECRDFAEHWIGVQAEEFQRLGVIGDWRQPYTTMAPKAEAQIVRELAHFATSGALYRGAKPVMWSVVEKTALADAEVEYADHTSTTIWVRFPVVHTREAALEGGSIVIWTTTPWTMPGNRAIAYGQDFEYVVVRVTATAEDSLARKGERFCVAAELLDETLKTAGVTAHEECARLPGSALAGTVCHHPWHGKGYDFEVPLLAGEHVTTEAGTGFVHIAPGHGEEDYWLGRAHGMVPPDTVAGDGLYFDHVPMFAGQHVFKVAPKILEAMTEAGALLAHGKLTHSYPHSWRSKAPLIFRNTPQWFISMETDDLRDKALAAIDETRWVPARGRNRIRAMIEQRPDWCVSRQRAWGVPLPLFVNRQTGEVLKDPEVFERIAQAFEQETSDAWFAADPCRFLGNDHDPDQWEPTRDIVEVWFDSGSTHAFVLEARDDLAWPADLYLEGSDQHRGWFHTSLLESCGTRGRAPYKAVLTHGFVLDEQGRKMSKSLGNVVSPQEVVDQYGADILRLWVVASDYAGDLRIGPEILKQMAEMYRRMRNTLRFLLGALAGFDAATEAVAEPADMPEPERWVLHRLAELDAHLRTACNDFAFHGLFFELNQFLTVDLSAVYLDLRKDALYCDAADSPRRRACRTVLDHLYQCLTRWLAPFLCFTAEEAWLARHPEAESIHLELFPDIPATWRDDRLGAKWRTVRDIRRVVTGALEVERAEKRIGASLQAAPLVYVTGAHMEALEGLDLAELAITSAVTVIEGAVPEGAFTLDDVPGVGVVPALAEGTKCARCWKVLPDVGSHHHPGVCGRCAEAIDNPPVSRAEA